VDRLPAGLRDSAGVKEPLRVRSTRGTSAEGGSLLCPTLTLAERKRNRHPAQTYSENSASCLQPETVLFFAPLLYLPLTALDNPWR
jgi:hypothetical protein